MAVNVLVVDINMPVMNGEEMIDEMLENPELRDIPIVVVSTEGSQTRVERLKDKGANKSNKPATKGGSL